MKVTLRSDAHPDVVLEAGAEACDLPRLDQHIRTLQAARKWLAAEKERRSVIVAGTTVKRVETAK